MPMFAILFEDDPERASDARRRFMADHLAFLDRNSDRLRSAGPLQDAPDGAPAGGLWIVDAASRGVVEALVHEDPFWDAGLRRSVRILEWQQVFADGHRV